MLLMRATQLRCDGEQCLELSVPSNVLLRVSGDALNISVTAPVEQDAGDVTIRAGTALAEGVKQVFVNGAPAEFSVRDGWLELTCDLPTWREVLP